MTKVVPEDRHAIVCDAGVLLMTNLVRAAGRCSSSAMTAPTRVVA